MCPNVQFQNSTPVDDVSNPLFICTETRWLTREHKHKQERCTKFNVTALMEVATTSLKSPYTRICKLAEGSNHKVYMLAFQDGRNAIARIPHTSMPERALLVASEAATLSFLASSFELPVPTVFAYSAPQEPNPVEAPYMIMEKMPGKALNDCVEGEVDLNSVYREVIHMEALLQKASLSCIGSLFFKKDLPHGQTEPLYADSGDDDTSTPFCIGPCMDPVFSYLKADAGSDENVDRGPWPTTTAYYKAILAGQLRGIDFYRCETPPSIDDHHYRAHLHRAALQYLLDFVDSVQLSPPKEFDSYHIRHPDLHRSNLLVQPSDNKVSAYLDWQAAMSDSAWNGARAPSCMVDEDTNPTESSQEESDLYCALLGDMEDTSSEIAHLAAITRHPARPFLPDLLRLVTESRWDAMMQAIWLTLLWAQNQEEFGEFLRVEVWSGNPPLSELPFTLDDLSEIQQLLEEHEWIREKQKEVAHKLEVGTDGHCTVDKDEEVAKRAAELRREYTMASSPEEVAAWWPFPEIT